MFAARLRCLVIVAGAIAATTAMAAPPQAAAGGSAAGSRSAPAAATAATPAGSAADGKADDQTAAEIRALIAGTLAPDVDARTLFEIDLADPAQADAIAAALGSGSADATGSGSAGATNAGSAALGELARARAAFLALPDATRAELLARHARDRAAWQAAKAAPKPPALPESARLLADARAHLAEIAARQQRVEAGLTADEAALAAIRDGALGWNRRVDERLAAHDSAATDAAYTQLVAALTERRDALDTALDQLDAPSAVPSFDAGDADPALADQRAAIAARATQLAAREERTRWATAAANRDAVVMMNRARLRLLDGLPADRRDALQGIGPEGRAQAARELRQIALELRYHVHALPALAASTADALAARPLATAKAVVLLLALIAFFRWWRSRATELLARPRADVNASWLRTAAVRALWYVARIRGPIEWLLLLWAAQALVPEVDDLPELALVLFVARWALVGTLAIRVLDAIVARQATLDAGADSTARLRYRSFRVIAVTVVGVGVVVALSRQAIGEGALYTWIWRSCWVLAFPIVLLLLGWWRAPIFARLAQRGETSAVSRWITAHETGLARFAATVAGAVWLLGSGVVHWLVARASNLNATRRMLAYMFRREVERQAATRTGDAGFIALREPAGKTLEQTAAGTVIVDVMAEDVAQVRALAHAASRRIVAVVGERGLGKTTFLRRVAEGLPAEAVVWITGEPGGYAAFLAAAARAIGAPSADEDAVCAALQARTPELVVIDDAHLLVRPMIGGLADLDRAMSFALRVGGTTTWAMAFAKHAWHFLRLARGERSLFDRVTELARWNEDDLARLTRARADAAGIAPRFDELVVSRRPDAAPYRIAERAERDYHRILWDYADGNPRVALHWWRESLFERGGDVFVRLFVPEPIDAAEPLPSGLRFVLRAIVQLDRACAADLVACTNLGAAEVHEALRAGLARGLVVADGDRYRISIHAFRGVTRFLGRQHLLLA